MSDVSVEAQRPVQTPEVGGLTGTAGADRCDACSAQAFVAAYTPDRSGMLLFCGHHYARNEAALAAGGWAITDERDRINARPSASSGTAADDLDDEPTFF